MGRVQGDWKGKEQRHLGGRNGSCFQVCVCESLALLFQPYLQSYRPHEELSMCEPGGGEGGC